VTFERIFITYQRNGIGHKLLQSSCYWSNINIGLKG